MSGYYAKETSVSVEKSRGELESMLKRYGGVGFAYALDKDRAMTGFRIVDAAGIKLAVRITMPIPDAKERRFTHTDAQQLPRTADRAHSMWEQECRALWRALVLVVRAKLEAVAIGISTIEREFMADMVMPNGQTLTEMMGGQIRAALESGSNKPLMLTGAVG